MKTVASLRDVIDKKSGKTFFSMDSIEESSSTASNVAELHAADFASNFIFYVLHFTFYFYFSFSLFFFPNTIIYNYISESSYYQIIHYYFYYYYYYCSFFTFLKYLGVYAEYLFDFVDVRGARSKSLTSEACENLVSLFSLGNTVENVFRLSLL